MQNQLPQPRSDQPFLDIVRDALKEVAPVWYEGLWERYSPKTYSAFKAAQKLEPYL